MVSRESNSQDGGSVFVRWLGEEPEDWAALPEAVLVSWSHPESGSPDDVLRAMEDFEGLLRPLWSAPDACLALIETFADSRVWTFYTGDPNAFAAELNRLLADYPPFPLELSHESDPSWSRWRKFSTLPKKAQSGDPGQRP